MLKGKSVHSAIDSLSIPLAFMFRAIFSWALCVPSFIPFSLYLLKTTNLIYERFFHRIEMN